MEPNNERNSEHRTGSLPMNTPPVVSAQEWETARQQLLVKEKALTRARDALAAERRRMPWLAVEKAYEFDGPKGKASLLDLFDGRRQLIVYRAFFEPGVFGWPEHACRGCSFGADQVAHLAHLNARDTTLVYASRAPQPDIERVKARMGWTIPWYTITDSFDTDFGVNEWHGHNAFIRDGDKVFRTYFINSRGDEAMGTTWSYLDMTALGRQETWEDSPEGYPQTPPYKWWNWHDNYDAEASPDQKWVKVSDAGEAAFRKRAERDADYLDPAGSGHEALTRATPRDRSSAERHGVLSWLQLWNRKPTTHGSSASMRLQASRPCSSLRVRRSRSPGAHPCRRWAGCPCPAAGRCRWRGCGCPGRRGPALRRRSSACGSR